MGNSDRARWAALVAIVGIGWWVATVVVLHFVTADDYDPVEQAISEMAHERYGVWLDISFFPLGLAAIAVALGLLWTVRAAFAAPVLLAISGVLWMVLGLFRTGPNGVTAEIHDWSAFASFLLILGVMGVCAWRFRGDANWSPFARPTLIWTIAAFATFFLFPILGDDGFGLAQRIYIATWMTWLAAITLRMRWMTVSVSQPA